MQKIINGIDIDLLVSQWGDVGKMKILMLTPDYAPDIYAGIGVYVEALVKSLLKVDNEIQITVVVLRCDGMIHENPVFYEYPEKVPVMRYHIKDALGDAYEKKDLNYFSFVWAKNNIDSLEGIMDFVQAEKFDLIHMHDFYLAWAMDKICRSYACPVVTTVHSYSSPVGSIEDAVKHQVLNRSAHIVAISQYLSMELKKRYELQPQMSIIYAGVMPGHPGGEKEHIITYAGRLSKAKGLDVLIQAFYNYILKSKDPILTLHIMGEGSEKNYLEGLCKSLGISERVYFRGYVPYNEVRKIINKAKVHVMPSKKESFGLSGLEAMAEGTAIIASDAGGISEYVKDGINGVLVPPGDSNALAAALQHLLDCGDDCYKKLVQGGLETARLMSWESTARQYVEIYKAVSGEIRNG